MDHNRKVIGVPAGRLIQMLVEDLGLFTQVTGGSAVYSPVDPLARQLILQMMTVPPATGGLLVTTLASLGPDQSQGGVGHVVQMNMATYLVSNVGLPIDQLGTVPGVDFASQAIARIMTYGFPAGFTSVVQGFAGYTPIDTSTVCENKNILVGRIDHNVYVALPGTAAYACDPITPSGRAALTVDGWRFGTLE